MILFMISVLGAMLTRESGHPDRERLQMVRPITFELRRPLISIAAASAIANEPAESLIKAAESGQIQFSFNIASPEATRRSIRVVASSLLQYIKGVQPGTEPPGALGQLVESIFPSLTKTIRTETLARLLDCEGQHPLQLAKLGLLRCVRAGRAGKFGSALFCRSSCVEFLKSRRLV